MSTVYKIRHKETGLYSMGGTDPRWSKTGKKWSKLGHITSHMRGLRRWGGYPHPYKDAEIVEYQVTEVEVGTQDALEYLKGRNDERDAKAATQSVRSAKRQREDLLKELEKLNRHIGFRNG
jgi:hypothetical protein